MKPWAASATTISELAVHKSAAHCRLPRSSLRVRVTLSFGDILPPSTIGSLSVLLLRPFYLLLRPIRRAWCNNFPRTSVGSAPFPIFYLR